MLKYAKLKKIPTIYNETQLLYSGSIGNLTIEKGFFSESDEELALLSMVDFNALIKKANI